MRRSRLITSFLNTLATPGERKYLVVTGAFGPWTTLICLITFGMSLTEAVYEVSLMWHGHPDSAWTWTRVRAFFVTITLGAWIANLRGRRVYETVL